MAAAPAPDLGDGIRGCRPHFGGRVLEHSLDAREDVGILEPAKAANGERAKIGIRRRQPVLASVVARRHFTRVLACDQLGEQLAILWRAHPSGDGLRPCRSGEHENDREELSFHLVDDSGDVAHNRAFDSTGG